MKPSELKAKYLADNLKPGELYAGLILGKDGHPDYHLIKLPDEPTLWDRALLASGIKDVHMHDIRAKPVSWNEKIRDSVDKLLAKAGFAEDSSVRHQLACMTFDRLPTDAPSQEPAAFYDTQERRFYWAKPTQITGVPVTVKVDPIPLYSQPSDAAAQIAELKAALQYHQEQTRPIQRTIDVLEKYK